MSLLRSDGATIVCVALMLLIAAACSSAPPRPPEVRHPSTGAQLVVQNDRFSNDFNERHLGVISPSGDRFVSLGSGGAVVWDLAAGRALRRIRAHRDVPRSVAFAPDGQSVATGSTKRVIISDVRTGATLFDLPIPEEHKSLHIAKLVYSRDGELLLGLSMSHGPVYFWHAKTGAALGHTDGNEIQTTGWPFVAALSDDKRYAVTSEERIARLWNLETKRQQAELPHGDLVNGAMFSPTSARLMTLELDVTDGGGPIRVWSAATGELIHTFECPSACKGGHLSDARVVAFDRHAVLVWDAATGQQLASAGFPLPDVADGVLSPAGDLLFVERRPCGFELWDVARRVKVRDLPWPEWSCAWFDNYQATFSANGDTVLAVASTGRALAWHTRNTDPILESRAERSAVESIAFSVRGDALLTMSIPVRDAMQRVNDYGWLTAWSLVTGTASTHATIGFSAPLVLPDSRYVAAVSEHGSARRVVALDSRAPELVVPTEIKKLAAVRGTADGKHVRLWGWDANDSFRGVDWDTAAGRIVGSLTLPFGREKLSISADGSHVAILEGSYLKLWSPDNNTTPAWERLFSGSWTAFPREFSPTGDTLYMSSWTELVLRRVATGEAILELDVASREAVFSVDGRHLAIAVQPKPDAGHETGLWDSSDGRRIGTLAEPNAATVPLAFSPSGAQLVTSDLRDGGALWDIASERVLHRLDEHLGAIEGAAFSADGAIVATHSEDGSVILWDTASGEARVRLVTFADGTWAAVDKEGRFDASDGGRVIGMHWVIDDEAYDLAQLHAAYYDPGLVAKVLGRSREALREVPPLANIRPPPAVRLKGPNRSGEVSFTLTDRGGGIGATFVTLNDSDISAHVASECPDLAKGKVCALELDDLPTYSPGRENRVKVFASTGSGLVRSRGVVAARTVGGDAIADPPDIWILAIGVSDYVGRELDLRFADADAASMSDALAIAGQAGFGEKRTHVRVLSTSRAERPTRANVEAAFAWLRQSDPLDTVIVFMAGHGLAHRTSALDDYFFLLADAASFEDVRVAELRVRRAWSGRDLADALSLVGARKRLIILDTCAAGRAADLSFAAVRDLSSDAVRAHTQARERTGAWVVAGATADKASYEASPYGHGVLTYALLEALRGPALLDGVQVSVERLVAWAEQRVPEYAKGVGGIQTPVVRRASDFTLGELNEHARGRIALPERRATVVRPLILAEGGRPDGLGLSAVLARHLRDVAAEPGAPLIIVDTDAMPDAWKVTGLYRSEGARWAFDGVATHTAAVPHEEVLSAAGEDVEAIAAALTEQIVAAVTRHESRSQPAP